MLSDLIRPQKPGRPHAAQNINWTHPEHADRLIVHKARPRNRRACKRVSQRGIRPPSPFGCHLVPVGPAHFVCEPVDMIRMGRNHF